jgi:choline monooxygenase
MVVNTGVEGLEPSSGLRGFYNVCQHRGGPLVVQNESVRMFRCKYHGWSYKLTGELVGTPKFAGVEDFNPENCSLKPVQVGIWEGLVFVNLDPRPPQPLEIIFGGIADRIQPLDLKNKIFAKRITYELACNWKVYVDNYMEGYHVGPVHPELSSLLDTDRYGFEQVNWAFLQHSPLRDGDSVYAKAGDGGEAFYWFVWPNIMLNILPGRLQVNSIVPVAPQRTRVIFDYYYDEVGTDAATRRMEDDINYSEVVQQQDIWICEQVHKGLMSGAYDRGRISVEEESGIHFFHERIKAFYRSCVEREQASLS